MRFSRYPVRSSFVPSEQSREFFFFFFFNPSGESWTRGEDEYENESGVIIVPRRGLIIKIGMKMYYYDLYMVLGFYLKLVGTVKYLLEGKSVSSEKDIWYNVFIIIRYF